MQMLHPVHAREQLVSKGSYQYMLDGISSSMVEHWQITRLPNNQLVYRTNVMNAGPSNDTHLLTHMVREEDGNPAWLRMRCGTELDRLSSAVQYTFLEATIRIVRQTFGEPVRQEVIDIAENYEVDYPPMLGHDYVWRGYPDDAEEPSRAIPIFSPELWEEGINYLSGRTLRYTIKPEGRVICETPAATFPEAAHYTITLSDGVRALAWYDEYGLPLRWQYPEKGYDVSLSAHERFE